MTTCLSCWHAKKEDAVVIHFFALYVESLHMLWRRVWESMSGGSRRKEMRQTKTAGGGRNRSSAVRPKREVKKLTRSEVVKSNAKMRSPSPERAVGKKRKVSRSPENRQTYRAPVSQPLREMLKRVEVKRKKARSRQTKYAKKLRATRGELSLLETASVKSSTKEEYLKGLRGFYNFVTFHMLPCQREEDLDAALRDYADELFLDGEDSHVGSKLQAALEFERPQAARVGTLHLPRFKRALKGWRKLAPQQVRMPLMEFLKSCIAPPCLFW